MKIGEKFKDFNAKGIWGLMSIVNDRSNPVFCCEKCKKYFGFFYYSVRMLSYFPKYNQNSCEMENRFFVKCRKCGHINHRIRVK